MKRLLAVLLLRLIMLIALVAAAVSLPSAPADGIGLGFFVFVFTGLALYWVLGGLIVLRADGHQTRWGEALFAPVRQRVQRLVDRRFDRARYDGERMASGFSVRMRDATDLSTVVADHDLTVRQAIALASVGLWLRGGER